MKSNTGVARTSSVVMMMMVFLLVTEHVVANEKCLQECYGACSFPWAAECYERCKRKCGNTQPQSLVDQVIQYCKLGCSLRQCSKYKNDKSKRVSCVGHCSNKYCNIKHLN
ncbi:hypothetical protein ACFX14_028491 [Malus domestica]